MSDSTKIDPRLNEIDDCLYRVSVRALIIQNDKILLVKEFPQMWWAFPGGGIDHGENVQQTLAREMEEELGVPSKEVTSDFQIVHYLIGHVTENIPRMNIFFKVSLPERLLKRTSEIAKWGWFTKDEFLVLNMHPSYQKETMADIIFG